ncbi:MAG: preprotein translocase subunit SecE [Oscillospiraceae bacterium]
MSKDKTNAVKKTAVPVKKPDPKEKKNFFGRVAQWFRDLKSELKKVVWPTKEQTINNTIVALVVMAFSAVLLWGFDSLAQAGVKALVALVG